MVLVALPDLQAWHQRWGWCSRGRRRHGRLRSTRLHWSAAFAWSTAREWLSCHSRKTFRRIHFRWWRTAIWDTVVSEIDVALISDSKYDWLSLAFAPLSFYARRTGVFTTILQTCAIHVSVRGKRWKDVYEFHSYAASYCRSCLYIPYGRYICPLSNGVW